MRLRKVIIAMEWEEDDGRVKVNTTTLESRGPGETLAIDFERPLKPIFEPGAFKCSGFEESGRSYTVRYTHPPRRAGESP